MTKIGELLVLFYTNLLSRLIRIQWVEILDLFDSNGMDYHISQNGIPADNHPDNLNIIADRNLLIQRS